MKTFFKLMFSAFAILGTTALRAQQAPAPVIEPTPLMAEQLAIYRGFLNTYNNDSHATLNIANTTEAFAPLNGDRKSCLKGFPFTHTAGVHRFLPNVFSGLDVRLVDPRLHQKRDPGDAIRKGEPVDDAVNAGFAAGIFTFSEIIFNSKHDRAAFTYSFVCGALCGNGGTIIFGRKDGKWIQEKNRCGSWIS